MGMEVNYENMKALEESNQRIRIALEKYERAIQEAEAILGGEYALHYGPFFELVEQARDASA